MEKISFETKNYTIDEFGIVKNKKTGEVLTCLGYPTKRQMLRYWWKHFNFKKWAKEEFNEICKAAAKATEGPWNHGNQF